MPSTTRKSRTPARRTKVSDYRAVETLEQIPNIGPSLAEDLRSIKVRQPRDLVGKDPYALYEALCKRTRTRQDPCVLDTFIAATRFMAGDTPQPWWFYTAERKRRVAGGSHPPRAKPADRHPPRAKRAGDLLSS